MLLLTLLATLIGVPMMASRGVGRRAHYIALAIMAPVLGFIVFSLPSGVSPGASAAEIRGAVIMDAWAPNIGGWLLTTALAAVVGAVLYRSQRRVNP